MKEKKEKAFRLDGVDRVVGVVFMIFTLIAIVSVIYIMLNTTVNVITRSFFSKSINGSVQTSQIVLSLVALCALPIVTMYNTHIKVDVVADKLPEKGQKFLLVMNLVISAATMFIAGYYTFIKAGKARNMGLSMDVPKFPHWPIYDLIAIMMIISGICAVYNIFHYAVTGTTIGLTTFDEVKARIKGKKEDKAS